LSAQLVDNRHNSKNMFGTRHDYNSAWNDELLQVAGMEFICIINSNKIFDDDFLLVYVNTYCDKLKKVLHDIRSRKKNFFKSFFPVR